MLQLVVPGHTYNGRSQNLPEPFIDNAPGFFSFLQRERGLREATILQYHHHLRLLESYLHESHIQALSDLSAVVISAFITKFGQEGNNKRSVQSLCSILKVLRYLYRTNRLARDLSRQIESPRHYRLANLPRSISWDEVGQMLESVDRRPPTGKRDYAILLLLLTYGLRAREVAALTLDNIDWKRDRLHIPERKAGHSTVYPLAPVVGEAILEYLQNGRPKTEARALFLRAFAPYTPLASFAVSAEQSIIYSKLALRSSVPVHIPCGTLVSNAWWMLTLRSKPLATTSATERQMQPTSIPRSGRGGGRGSFLGLGLRCAQNAPKDGAGLHSVRGQGGPSMRFRGGEFSTGTKGNFQPELT
jgi:integrase/recombinase XerD